MGLIKVKSVITKKGNKFEFRHDPSDLKEYPAIKGEMDFLKNGEMVMTMNVEKGEVNGLEAVYNYRKYQ